MADEDARSAEALAEAARLVERAYDSLGEDANGTPDAVMERVVRRALNLRRLTNPRSIAMLTLMSSPIRCRVASVEFEEATQRFVIGFVAAGSETGEVEQIRSDRVDGPDGRIVRKLWNESLVGRDVVIYKLNEPAKPGSKASHGYRCAHWVQPLSPVRRDG